MASIQEKLVQAIQKNEINKCLHMLSGKAKLTTEALNAIHNGSEELKKALNPLIDAKNKVFYAQGQRIRNLNQRKLDHQLSMAINKGKPKVALALLAHGAHLSLESVKCLQKDTFQARHNETYKVFQPYMRCFFAKGAYTSGQGNFTAMHETREVSSSQINTIAERSESNKILKTALTLTKALDKANKKDIKTLSLFLKQLDNPLSSSQLIEAMQHDREKLKQLKSRIPKLEIVNLEPWKLLIKYKMLDRAMRWLEQNPQLSRGYLHKYLNQYTSMELTCLKTIFLYASVLNHIDESVLEKLHSFYQLKLPEAYNNALRCIPSDTFYLPTAGYVLYGDQCRSDKKNTRVALTDCSGFITNVMRELQPENTWLQKNRFRSWTLEKGHDKKINRWTISNEQKGPLNTAKQRRALHPEEKQRVKQWLNSRRGRACFQAIDSCFDLVKDHQNISAGDVIVYRQRIGNDVLSSRTGHVAIVAEYDPDTNKSILLEYTRSKPYAGLGFTSRPICYPSDNNKQWETRIFRPKVNQQDQDNGMASSSSSSSMRAAR